MDMKDWIQNKAEELALELYDADYFDLDEDTQKAIFDKACEDYHDYYAAKVDAACDRWKEE